MFSGGVELFEWLRFVSISQHCDEQQFRNTVMCTGPYMILSVVKLDLCIQALSLDYILALK